MALVCVCSRYAFSPLFTRQIQSSLPKFHTLGKFNSKILLTTEIRTQPKRNYFWIFKKRTNRELRLVDNPPESCELVYRCTMDNMFYSFQHLGFYTAALLCLGVLIESSKIENIPLEERDEVELTPSGHVAISAENQTHIMLGAFFFAYCVILWFMTRVPVRIYYHPGTGKYWMYLYKAFPSKVKIIKVGPGDLKESPGAMFNLWKYDMYEFEKSGENFLLLEEYFKYPADLYVMLGQQPERGADTMDQFQPRDPK